MTKQKKKKRVRETNNRAQKPKQAPAAQAALEPLTVALALPMLRLTRSGGGEIPLPTKRLDIMLLTSEVRALCDLCDGMRLAGIGKPRATHKDALRWLLHELGARFEQARYSAQSPTNPKNPESVANR